jgi:hypothetical protein
MKTSRAKRLSTLLKQILIMQIFSVNLLILLSATLSIKTPLKLSSELAFPKTFWLMFWQPMKSISTNDREENNNKEIFIIIIAYPLIRKKYFKIKYYLKKLSAHIQY